MTSNIINSRTPGAPDIICRRIQHRLLNLERAVIDVSIVVIAHNEEGRILKCIRSLSEVQTDYSVELIVVNNASTDRTREILEKCGVHIVDQPVKGFGYARQAGLDASRGRYLLTADADTIYPTGYVNGMIRELRRPGVSVVFGLYGFLADGRQSRLTLAIYSFFKNLMMRIKSVNSPELAAVGFCMGFYTENGLKTGFKTNIKRGEDGSMLFAQKQYGKARLVTDRNARPMTTSRTLDADGNLLQLVFIRLFRELKRIPIYLKGKKEYIDRDYNLMK